MNIQPPYITLDAWTSIYITIVVVNTCHAYHQYARYLPLRTLREEDALSSTSSSGSLDDGEAARRIAGKHLKDTDLKKTDKKCD